MPRGGAGHRFSQEPAIHTGRGKCHVHKYFCHKEQLVYQAVKTDFPEWKTKLFLFLFSASESRQKFKLEARLHPPGVMAENNDPPVLRPLCSQIAFACSSLLEPFSKHSVETKSN